MALICSIHYLLSTVLAVADYWSSRPRLLRCGAPRGHHHASMLVWMMAHRRFFLAKLITHNLVDSCNSIQKPANQITPFATKDMAGRKIRSQNPCHFHLTFRRMEQMPPPNSDPTFHPS